MKTLTNNIQLFIGVAIGLTIAFSFTVYAQERAIDSTKVMVQDDGVTKKENVRVTVEVPKTEIKQTTLAKEIEMLALGISVRNQRATECQAELDMMDEKIAEAEANIAKIRTEVDKLNR